MLDAALLPAVRALTAPAAQVLVRRGVNADAVTLAGFALGALALPALACGQWGAGLALILANRIADGLDGAVAREAGPTDRGAFLDAAADFLFYALVPLGFALAAPEANALAAAALVAAFAGTGSSFLAFAAVAARRGMEAARHPRKGLYYLGGLTEGAETIAVFAAMCLWPGLFPVFAWGFAAACLVTTAARWREGWRAFAPGGRT